MCKILNNKLHISRTSYAYVYDITFKMRFPKPTIYKYIHIYILTHFATDCIVHKFQIIFVFIFVFMSDKVE